MRGQRADISEKRVFAVSPLGKDSINGLMYHIGSFPGIKLLNGSEGTFDDNQPKVKGEVYVLNDPSVSAWLDAYEGYHSDAPESGLYNRKQVETCCGRIVWVYVYNGPVVSDQLIETGDWRNPRLTATRKIPEGGING
jgi:gamma-glutamylcyclotransferase (GGCT)/AIG2-like uncharacterized protein YtfP